MKNNRIVRRSGSANIREVSPVISISITVKARGNSPRTVKNHPYFAPQQLLVSTITNLKGSCIPSRPSFLKSIHSRSNSSNTQGQTLINPLKKNSFATIKKTFTPQKRSNHQKFFQKPGIFDSNFEIKGVNCLKL
jgi:hypothetical protein